MRWTQSFAAVALLCKLASAGGPEFVAGASYFDPTTKGAPLIWAQGAITYYTDQGDLSALLPGPARILLSPARSASGVRFQPPRFQQCAADSSPKTSAAPT